MNATGIVPELVASTADIVASSGRLRTESTLLRNRRSRRQGFGARENSTMHKRWSMLIAAVLAIVLAACGTGGGAEPASS